MACEPITQGGWCCWAGTVPSLSQDISSVVARLLGEIMWERTEAPTGRVAMRMRKDT